MANGTVNNNEPKIQAINIEIPVLSVKDISKTFSGVQVLKKVSFDLYQGEVLAICGENGAGKSTLMKCISGIYHADKDNGHIKYLGDTVRFNDALQAKKSGIAMIFQEVSLLPELSVAENMCMGMLPTKAHGIVDYKAMYNKAKEVFSLLELDIDPWQKAGGLSIAQQQMVEIARALAMDSRVLILDEPTSSLTEKEKVTLFKNIHRMKDHNTAIIYISHKMDEIFEISDRILVLRDGEVSGLMTTAESKLDDVIMSMIGRSVDQLFYKSTAKKSNEEVLKVEHLSQGEYFSDISFSVHKGEILGLYGLVGAGRSELVETIFGIRRADGGKMSLCGRELKIKSSSQAVRAGLALVPENRKAQGLYQEKTCVDNISATTLKKNRAGIFENKKEALSIFDKYRKSMSIVASGPEQWCINLSGGNQQKIVIGKWLATNPKLLILDEPTKGVDVVAKSEIHKMISEIAGNGMSVIVISSEMPEIIGVSDRILTMANGRLNGEFTGSEINEENLMKAISDAY